jgi:hypothetical protein
MAAVLEKQLPKLLTSSARRQLMQQGVPCCSPNQRPVHAAQAAYAQ